VLEREQANTRSVHLRFCKANLRLRPSRINQTNERHPRGDVFLEIRLIPSRLAPGNARASDGARSRRKYTEKIAGKEKPEDGRRGGRKSTLECAVHPPARRYSPHEYRRFKSFAGIFERLDKMVGRREGQKGVSFAIRGIIFSAFIPRPVVARSSARVFICSFPREWLNSETGSFLIFFSPLPSLTPAPQICLR